MIMMMRQDDDDDDENDGVLDLPLVPHISLTLTEEDDPLEEADSWVPPSAPIRGDSTFK
jgi:hypothetical protein